MKMNKKGLVVLLALVGLFATVGTSLAYWASSVGGSTGNATGTVEVGTGAAVSTTVNVSNFTAGAELVPAGFDDDTPNAETDSVSMVFPVSWESTDDDGAGATGTLTVAKTGLTVDGGADTYNLVNVSIPAPVAIVADAAALNVTVVVTLGLPADATQYAAVAGKTIVITFSFTVA